jgi:DNA-binding NtrC family response regulator
MTQSTNVLIVENEEGVRGAVRSYLEGLGYTVVEAGTVAEGLVVAQRERLDAVLIDYALPDGDGITLLRNLRELGIFAPALVLTAHSSIDLAVEAIKEGAEQFLIKPIQLGMLRTVLERAIGKSRLRNPSGASWPRASALPLEGDSPAMQALRALVLRVEGSMVPTLLVGESGTGKTAMARYLHKQGSSGAGALIEVNCASSSPSDLERQLFGGERTQSRPEVVGLLEAADGGTLLLEEVGQLPSLLQVRVHQVLEEGAFYRLGETVLRRTRFRVIATSQVAPKRLLESNAVRADLLHRIHGVVLTLPPLRARGDDVLAYARRMLATASPPGADLPSLAPETEQALRAHSWPGNFRELQHVVARVALLASGAEIRPADLALWPAAAQAAAPGDAADQTLQEAERRHLAAVLVRTGGEVRQAARILGISRSALYERIKRHHLESLLPRSRNPHS